MALSFPLGLSFPISEGAGGLFCLSLLKNWSLTLGSQLKKGFSCEVNQSFRMSRAPSAFRTITQQSCHPLSSPEENRVLREWAQEGGGRGRWWWVPKRFATK